MKTYRVSGPNAVLEHAPGQTFQADLDEVQERRLIESGSLEETSPTTTKEDKPTPSTSPASDAGKEQK